MKIAIVHDFLNQYGGAEKVVEVLHDLYPTAPIYTSFYIPKNLSNEFKQMEIHTTFMQHIPRIGKFFKRYFLLYPFAFRSFDLSGYDVILSSSSAFAKGIKKPAGALHISYCYTPARFIWRFGQYIEKENIPGFLKFILKRIMSPLRKWDILNSAQVDYFIAISDTIRKRINDCYSRDSVVIYPPVDTAKFQLSDVNGDYYLVVSRLNAYKRIDIVVRAFSDLGIPLRIIGEGPHLDELMKISSTNIQFLGRCSNEEVIKQVSECRAFVFPGEEDFGIAPVEAQSAGRPVVAFAAGGALETVIDGVTGVFFKEQDPESLKNAVHNLERCMDTFDRARIRANALRFDREVFKEKIKQYVEEKLHN